jgi:hypothetical protein
MEPNLHRNVTESRMHEYVSSNVNAAIKRSDVALTEKLHTEAVLQNNRITEHHRDTDRRLLELASITQNLMDHVGVLAVRLDVAHFKLDNLESRTTRGRWRRFKELFVFNKENAQLKGE